MYLSAFLHEMHIEPATSRIIDDLMKFITSCLLIGSAKYLYKCTRFCQEKRTFAIIKFYNSF